MNTDSFDKWFAGFFDGEGCIGKFKHTRSLRVSQSLNPERPVKKLFDKIKEQYGGMVRLNIAKEKRHLNQLEWTVYKRDKVREIIRRILPFSILRKRDLEKVLSFYDACQ